MWIFFFVFVSLFYQSSGIPSLHWLTGIWEMKKMNGTSRLEIWSKSDESLLVGRGLKISSGDTTLLESIELISDSEYVWYVPTVHDQNNAQPVRFKMISDMNNKFVFENEHHDFPKRIIYHFKPVDQSASQLCNSGDTLQVRVENIKGDEGIDFIFLRK